MPLIPMMRKKCAGPRTAFTILLMLALAAGGCARKEGGMGGEDGFCGELQNAAGEIRDTETVPQDLMFFAGKEKDAFARSAEGTGIDAAHYRKRFFGPWGMKRADQKILAEGRKIFARKPGRRGFAENLRPWTERDWIELRENADMEHAGRECRPAITVHKTALRLAPTFRPQYARLQGAGEGYPFDDFQQTSLPAGMPLFAVHTSRDRAWVFVHSALASGWVPSVDVAYAPDEMRSLWERSEFAVFLKDDVPLVSGGVFLAMADIGTVLPLDRDGSVLVPVRDVRSGLAGYVPVRTENGSSGVFPQEFTTVNVARCGNLMMGRKYGWGGLYGDRDCSAMMRDLFTVFGIWLPRNSAAQAKAGRFSDLTALDGAAKEARIMERGLPFRTLLWLKGHIGLYVGTYGGLPVFYHESWGVRNRLSDGRDGRVIVGRAVVTTTSPGRERSDIPEDYLMRTKLRGFTVLGAE